MRLRLTNQGSDRKDDAAEREANKARQRQDYYYNWHNVPRGQRK